ncbi:MAG: VOC family protein [Novosphingobium sp.]|nr:VOC family protein [Novosphingobium sp.]
MRKFAATLAAAAALAASTGAIGQSPDPQPVAGSAAQGSIVGPGYFVSDMDKSLEFYRDILGMTVRMKFGDDDHPEVVIGYGSQMTGASIMLLTDRKQGKPRKIEQGHGYSRLAINIPDIAGLKAKLTKAGYESTEINVVHDAFLMMMATDPDGYRIEVLQTVVPK